MLQEGITEGVQVMGQDLGVTAGSQNRLCSAPELLQRARLRV